MNLQQWRKKHGLTQAEAAERLDVAQSSICRIEQGDQWPPPETILKLSRNSDRQITLNALWDAWLSANGQEVA